MKPNMDETVLILYIIRISTSEFIIIGKFFLVLHGNLAYKTKQESSLQSDVDSFL